MEKHKPEEMQKEKERLQALILEAFWELEQERLQTVLFETFQEVEKQRLQAVILEAFREAEQERLQREVLAVFGELKWEQEFQEIIQEFLVISEEKRRVQSCIEHFLQKAEKKQKKFAQLCERYQIEYQYLYKKSVFKLLAEMQDKLEEEEDKKTWERYKRKTFRRMKLATGILAVAALMSAIGFAWYSRQNKHAITQNMQIMTPYTLYLLNQDATDYLQLSVGDIHPGETKEIVVCVSSQDKNPVLQTAKEGVFPYQLELVYTNNMQLTFEMYPITSIGENGSYIEGSKLTPDSTKQQEKQEEMYGNHEQGETGETAGTGTEDLKNIVNLGHYDVYDRYTDKDGNNTQQKFQLSLSEENDVKKRNYFLIKIKMADTMNLDEFAKETDLIYLLAKAGVPAPIEKNETE